MRRRVLILIFLGGGGCSLFLDTGGFEGAPETTSPEASTSTDSGGSNADTGAGSDAASSDATNDAAADAGFDVQSALVGDWPFDEGSGTIINDKSGHAHAGVIFGGSWVADHTSAAANAIGFDGGASSYVSISGDPDFDRPATPSFSMMAWARVDDVPSHDMFFSVSFGMQDSSYGIEIQNETTINYWDGQSHTPQVNVPSVVGAWHHYGVVVEGTQARIYFDGVRLGQATADVTPRTSTQVFFGRSSFGDFLTGAVDKARYFRVALTDAEMMAEKNR